MSYTFSLTKIQIRLKLDNALDEKILERISDAQAIYGIDWIRLDPSMTSILVEYDATRMRPTDLAANLRKAGLAVEN